VVIRGVIVDTGPLAAFFDADDAWHGWTVNLFQEFAGPLVTVEPVLTELMFLLRKHPTAQDRVLKLVSDGALQLPFQLAGESEAVRSLRAKYRDLPMSLADACLVRLAELRENHSVCTLDSDFTIYRKHGREPIPLVTPASR
jgi:predicted nucleic acid-binding protein